MVPSLTHYDVPFSVHNLHNVTDDRQSETDGRTTHGAINATVSTVGYKSVNILRNCDNLGGLLKTYCP